MPLRRAEGLEPFKEPHIRTDGVTVSQSFSNEE